MKSLVFAVCSNLVTALPATAQAWQEWWRLNEARFLQLRVAVRDVDLPANAIPMTHWDLRGPAVKLDPTPEQLRELVVPALQQVLADESDEDLVSSCLVALAKIGHDPAGATLVELIGRRLDSESREVRRSALLALGIAGSRHPQAVDVLLRMAANKKCDLRAFAAHAVGVALRDPKLPARARFVTALRSLLEDQEAETDLRVGAVQAIGHLRGDPAALICLKTAFEHCGDPLVRAHCPTAIARLVDSEGPAAQPLRDLFARDLDGNEPLVRQSCALALGELCRPSDRHTAVLREVAEKDGEPTVRHFAILALGQIGGEAQRGFLLSRLCTGDPATRAWSALALGVYSFRAYERQKATAGYMEPDDDIGEKLLEAFAAEESPAAIGALAIGLGLNQHTVAADPMRELLLDSLANDDLRSHLGIGLALMNDTASTEDVRLVLERSQRRPELFVRTAMVLGRLGDKRTPEDILRLVAKDSHSLLEHAGRMTALGWIGDRRAVAPLCEILWHTDLPAPQRAFAALALGGICAQDDLPWNASLADNLNFHAMTPTLSNRDSGVLDRF